LLVWHGDSALVKGHAERRVANMRVIIRYRHTGTAETEGLIKESGFFFSSRGKKCPSNGGKMEVTKITAASLYRLVIAGVLTKQEARAILKKSGLL